MRGITKGTLLVLAIAAGIGAAAPVATAGTLSEYRLLLLGGGIVKWGEPVLGRGAHLTYAIADSAASFKGARNCADIVPVDGLLGSNRIDRAIFEAEAASAFDAWSRAADVTFQRTDARTADIVIGAQAAPLGRAFTNVASVPSDAAGGTGRITGSVICLNPEEPWKVGFDGNLGAYDIRYTLMHEIGHALGLDHPGVPGVLMDFRYLEAFSVPQDGDRLGVERLYGPKLTDTAAVPAPPPQ